MKKIITLLMAVALVATVSAQVQFDGRSIKNKRILSNEKVNSKAKSGFSKNRVHTKALGELITEQPEGEAKQYVRSGFGFVVYDNTLFTTEQEGKTTIVYDEDGTIGAKYPSEGIPYTLIIKNGVIEKIFLGSVA